MTNDVSKEFPEFESEDELRDWFDSAELTEYNLGEALEVVVANQVRLVVGDEEIVSSSSGTTGTFREPVRLVTTQR